jgi:hypothetical protein
VLPGEKSVAITMRRGPFGMSGTSLIRRAVAVAALTGFRKSLANRFRRARVDEFSVLGTRPLGAPIAASVERCAPRHAAAIARCPAPAPRGALAKRLQRAVEVVRSK